MAAAMHATVMGLPAIPHHLRLLLLLGAEIWSGSSIHCCCCCRCWPKCWCGGERDEDMPPASSDVTVSARPHTITMNDSRPATILRVKFLWCLMRSQPETQKKLRWSLHHQARSEQTHVNPSFRQFSKPFQHGTQVLSRDCQDLHDDGKGESWCM